MAFSSQNYLYFINNQTLTVFFLFITLEKHGGPQVDSATQRPKELV